MLRVRPFRAWRYARPGVDITPVAAPPYDVISAAHREELLQRDVNNVVALELPEGSLDPEVSGNRYEVGAARWRQWREEGVLARDTVPALYVLEQRYETAGQRRRRRALISAVGLEPFEAGVILPHERTLPKALGDRYALISACDANFSQVLGLVDEPTGTVAAAMAEITKTPPLQTATDDDGVASALWAISDPDTIARIVEALEPTRVFIADGHHRYTTALAYRDARRAEDAGAAADDPEYDYVMMALIDMTDPGLVVLPTHRVADASSSFDCARFWDGLGEHFEIEAVEPGHPADILAETGQPSFLVKVRGDGSAHLVRLKAGLDPAALIAANHSDAWKRLDVATLQELILEPLLGIHPDRPDTLERLSFVKDAHAALKMADDHDVVFLMRPTSIEQMREVALRGEIMPQKSTYFYPKLLSGLVLRSMD